MNFVVALFNHCMTYRFQWSVVGFLFCHAVANNNNGIHTKGLGPLFHIYNGSFHPPSELGKGSTVRQFVHNCEDKSR